MVIIGLNASGLVSKWALFALLSPLSFALCSLFISAKQPPEISSLQAASGMLVAASLILMPLVYGENAFYSLAGQMTAVKVIIILEIILSSLGYLLFFILIRIAGPIFYSFTGGMVAITGLFWGYLIFGETPSIFQCMAVTLILCALFLLSWRQSRQIQRR